MKLTINRTKLIECVTKASKVIVGRLSLPALLCVLLDAKTGVLTATCSDLDRYLSIQSEATVDTEGSCAVSASRLGAALQKMDSLDVNLVHEKGKLTVTGGERVMNLFTLPVEEFPKIPATLDGAVEIPAGLLGTTIAAVAPFASNDPSRERVCGVCMHYRKDLRSMAAVATTGKVLGLKLVESMPKLPAEAIIPNASVKILVALDGADAPQDSVTSFAIGESGIRARGHDWTLCSKLIEGEYPNYAPIIPAEGKFNITFARSEMLAALAFAGLCVSETAPSVKVAASESEITISSNTPGQCDGVAPVERLGSKKDRKPTEVAYAPDQLRQALALVGGEECTINLQSASDPCLIRNGDATAVLMPYRIQ